MKSKKATRRALFSSFMSLLLCCSMLVGTTFAWFTDSVTSNNNIIQSGNLDVEMYYQVEGQTDWTQVKADTNIFKKDALWEPGHTEVVKLKIVNKGSLALKYQLSVNVASEIGSINMKGDPFKLSDHIKFGIVDGAQTYTREQAIDAVDATAIALSTGYTSATTELPANTENEDTVTMVVYMPTSVDNVANHAKGAAKPTINLGLKLLATQMEAEIDSFGPEYDEDATYTDVVVTSEEEFKQALAEGKDGMIIGIRGNVTWTTGASHGSTPFVDSTAAVMAAEESTVAPAPAPVKNITLVGLEEGATFTAVGAGVGPIGIDGGTVTFRNLKIADQSVSYAEDSWEFGYLEFRGNTVFANCDIVNAIMMEGESAKFVNCSFNSNADNEYAVWVSNGSASFENCTFTGARGLKIHEDYGSEVVSVTAESSTFSKLTKKPGVAIGTVNADTAITLKNNLFVGTQAGDQGLYSYETDTDVTTFDFVEENNSVAGAASNSDELKNELKDNATVYLNEGEYSLPSMSGKEGITIIGGEGVVVGGENTATGFGSNFGKNTTIKDVTFSGSTNGVRYSYANGGTSTFDNCTFAGDSTYGFHIDQSNGATFIFNNCTFIGFNAFAGDLEKVIFNNCTFLSNGNYGHTNIWSVGEFNNCTWGDKTSVSPAGSGKLYFNDVEESYHHEFIGSAESLVAFAESVNVGKDSWKGQKVLLVADIDLKNAEWTPIGQTGATEFKGIFDGQNYTISNLKVDSSAKTDGHYSSGLFGWAESNVTIQNVKVDGASVTGNHNVAVIVGYTYSGKISNCHVTNAAIVCNHANDDACGDKCGLIAGYAADESRISDCSASNSTVTAGRDAGQLVGCGYNVSMINGSASNVAVTATGECTGANINEAFIGRVMG